MDACATTSPSFGRERGDLYPRYMHAKRMASDSVSRSVSRGALSAFFPSVAAVCPDSVTPRVRRRSTFCCDTPALPVEWG